MRSVAVAIALAGVIAGAARDTDADPDVPTPFDAVAEAARGCDPAAVAALIAALPAAPTPGAAAGALFTTARKCETEAGDPVTALALYQRILRDHPDEGVAVGAGRQARALGALIGPDGAGAESARRLAALKARTAAAADDATLAEAEALGRATWPGAGDAALWRADRLRALGRLAPAAAAYDDVLARFAGTTWAHRAAEGAAAIAIARDRFDEARRRIAALPIDDPADHAVRDDLADQLDSRERRIGWYHRAWIALIAAIVLLLGSLAEAARSARRAVRALVPPAEVWFATPIVAVLIATSLTSHVEIGPAVAIISCGGLVLAWLSGAGLFAAHRAGRAIRGRALAHVAITGIAVAALAYIAITRSDLLEMIVETVRFGPET